MRLLLLLLTWLHLICAGYGLIPPSQVRLGLAGVVRAVLEMFNGPLKLLCTLRPKAKQRLHFKYIFSCVG